MIELNLDGTICCFEKGRQ